MRRAANDAAEDVIEAPVSGGHAAGWTRSSGIIKDAQ